MTNETLPVPSGVNILEIYGNEIKGNKKEDIVKIMFIIILDFIDFLSFNFIMLYNPF
ncbi:hypothetical protein HOLDEFILI_02052 [Holdemania filiformis DSM 12042]|uniref:Uncharacterized protein n=1 Tax=Holdemania filiformis DSM 12042 TaxID=545696 RepID=B9Y8A5_9FIRM|nr:hypothetical protein HOLDEFILI_02052 [Holdemania filiformis DSM 12042]